MQIKYIKEGYFKSYDKLAKSNNPKTRLDDIAKRNQKLMIHIVDEIFKTLIDAAAISSAHLFHYNKAGRCLDKYIYIDKTATLAPAITKIQCTDIENDSANTIHVIITVAHTGYVKSANARYPAITYTVNSEHLYDSKSKKQILSDLSHDITQHLYSFATSAFPGRPLIDVQNILQHPIVIDDIIMCNGDSYPVAIVFDESLLTVKNTTPDDPNFSKIIESAFDLITNTFTFLCDKEKMGIYYKGGDRITGNHIVHLYRAIAQSD